MNKKSSFSRMRNRQFEFEAKPQYARAAAPCVAASSTLQFPTWCRILEIACIFESSGRFCPRTLKPERRRNVWLGVPSGTSTVRACSVSGVQLGHPLEVGSSERYQGTSRTTNKPVV